MNNAFKEVAKLNKLEKVGLMKKTCKLAEESGELMQVVCRHIGMKANTMSKKEMREEALGEIADVVQNCFCIISETGSTYRNLEAEYGGTLDKMYLNASKFIKETPISNVENNDLETLACEFYQMTGVLVRHAAHAHLSKDVWNYKKTILGFCSEVIYCAFSISAKLGIKYKEIEPKIREKDKKWLARIDKNKNKK